MGMGMSMSIPSGPSVSRSLQRGLGPRYHSPGVAIPGPVLAGAWLRQSVGLSLPLLPLPSHRPWGAAEEPLISRSSPGPAPGTGSVPCRRKACAGCRYPPVPAGYRPGSVCQDRLTLPVAVCRAGCASSARRPLARRLLASRSSRKSSRHQLPLVSGQAQRHPLPGGVVPARAWGLVGVSLWFPAVLGSLSFCQWRSAVRSLPPALLLPPAPELV